MEGQIQGRQVSSYEAAASDEDFPWYPGNGNGEWGSGSIILANGIWELEVFKYIHPISLSYFSRASALP